MSDKVFMEEMSWAEIKEAIDQGKDTALVFVGAISQHGPHLPTGADTLIGYAWGELIARKLGNALVAPVIRPTYSDLHLGFPGTISLRLETVLNIIRDYCDSLAASGFKAIVLSLCFGSFTLIDAVAPSIAKSLKGVKIVTFTDIRGLVNKWFEIAGRYGITPEEGGVHSGEAETSLLLAIRPDLVNRQALEKGFVGDSVPLIPRLYIDGMKAHTQNGIIGDATKADVKRGEVYLQELTDYIAGEMRRSLAA
ncbi:MAG: creatininase family protein [Dehalococcoidia bacterium]